MNAHSFLTGRKHRIWITCLFLCFIACNDYSQAPRWAGMNSYHVIENNEIIEYTLPGNDRKVVVANNQLEVPGYTDPLKISFYSFSTDHQKVLLFTNTQKVWRLRTRGDYWIFNLSDGSLHQLGKSLPSASLMFAKFSPDGRYAAYVSGNNIYCEEVNTGQIRMLTKDGTQTLINGTFDWAYEEEFYCRDGFRWSPDGKSIAYWQIDAGHIGKFLMINNTESNYSKVIPVEYPKAGEKPSSSKIGVVNVESAQTTWMRIPGEPDQHYIIRMEFIPFSNELLIHQLNRKQDQGRLYTSQTNTGDSKLIYEEKDSAWVEFCMLDFLSSTPYAIDYTNDFTWLNDGKSILWISEKDGWKHLYEISLEGKPERQITKGDFDVIELKHAEGQDKYVYFTASPDNATQRYLYRSKLNGTGSPELLSPLLLKGVHTYLIGPGAKYALHGFTSHNTRPSRGFITLPDHRPVTENESIAERISRLQVESNIEFFTITTVDDVTMDGWMVKPYHFDPGKKYPVLFHVYTEPGNTTVVDRFGIGGNSLYHGDMAEDGYIYISLDNRGTPAPKGRAWRKAIYGKIGLLNIRDQAMAAKEILKWDFIDTSRVAVSGWSGGGTATLNLMFQYPDIFKTGIAIAAVTHLLTYDNIYQERYMGLPQESMENYVNGSPITYAKNLKGNLLYIHGTGDDNVHYQNAEMLVNALVQNNKHFHFMAYPNRTHNISEGEGTSLHLISLYTDFLKEYCPPGPR